VAKATSAAQRFLHNLRRWSAVRASVWRVGLGVGGATIASGSRVRPSHSWTSRLLTSSFSLGVSSLFCRATQCMFSFTQITS
jgi:hypothetical protein